MLSPALLMSLAMFSQAYGQPDRGQPGDELIQKYLAQEAVRLDAQFTADVASKEVWEGNRERYRQEYLYMLGLWPLPEKSPLKATITGTLERDGYAVDKLHYQSKPGLYVTGNLYRPRNGKPGTKYPAVLYVCGHANGGRNGSKTPYMAHPIWLAKHGFICLIVDTLELGEILAPSIHHGTYSLERWWWHSRGYTTAGVECWNGVRGIDYLLSRDDVDPNNLGVTGISGGGAATFWIAAADERIKCAIPVSGMADLESYVGNRVINGHCDCMFLYNTFQWPWTRIAGLIAPRPMLFMNSDNDGIFPMDANERITNRMERLYSLYGASDKFDTVVSVGGHAYREDLRRASFQFLRYHLQGNAEPVTDSELDLVDTSTKPPTYPIPPEELRVFPTDEDLPKDALNINIDQHFVPIAQLKLPTNQEEFEGWQIRMIEELNRVVFRPILRHGIRRMVFLRNWSNRGLERIRRTMWSGLWYCWDIRPTSTGSFSHRKVQVRQGKEIEAQGPQGLIAAYGLLFEGDPEVRLTYINPPVTHMDPKAPQFLNILRVCDVPDMLGLLAPRPLKIVTSQPGKFERTKAIYQAAGAANALTITKP